MTEPARSLRSLVRGRWPVALVLLVIGVGIVAGGRPATTAVAQTPPVPAVERVPNEVIVQFVPSASPDERRGAARDARADVVKVAPRSNAQLLRVRDGEDVDQAIARLRGRGDVIAAAPNQIVRAAVIPNDPSWPQQWAPVKIGAPAAWDRTTGSASVIIAVIDTGVATGHPEFAGRIVAGFCAVQGCSSAEDDNGHGTHVAGIAAAAGDNGIGFAGLAWQSRIQPIKILDGGGSGTTFDLAEGIDWAVANGADVINMSLTGSSFSQVVADAVARALAANVVVVAASGNQSGTTAGYPAALPGVLSVAASTQADANAWFSNCCTNVNIAAPGVGILSAWLNGGYATYDGTSMASPHVAGAAALVRAAYPSWTAAQVRSRLISTADAVGIPVPRLNVDRAVAPGGPVPPTATPPAGTATPPTATATPPTATATPTAPPAPSAMTASGRARLNGVNAPAGTAVTAWIGSQSCGSTAVTGGNGSFSLQIAAASQTAGCGTNGVPVLIRIAGVAATPSFAFQSGGNVSATFRANGSASTPTPTQPPTATPPTATPTASPTSTPAPPTSTPTRTATPRPPTATPPPPTPTPSPSPTTVPGLSPMQAYGNARINGVFVPSGTVITAWVGSRQCGTTTTSGGSFVIAVASATQTAGCGTNGATVTLRVNGQLATPTVTFQSGGFTTAFINAAP